MTVHYLPTEATMHTTDWPARRVTEQCESAAGCTCLVTGVKTCGAPQPAECSTEIGADMPHSRDEACSPMVGVIVGSSIGALLICGALWAWRSL